MLAITSKLLDLLVANIMLLVVAALFIGGVWVWAWFHLYDLKGNMSTHVSRLDSMAKTVDQVLNDVARDQSTEEFIKATDRLMDKFGDINGELKSLREEVNGIKTPLLVSGYPKRVMLASLDRFGDVLDKGLGVAQAVAAYHAVALVSAYSEAAGNRYVALHDAFEDIATEWGTSQELRKAMDDWDKAADQQFANEQIADEALQTAYANADDRVMELADASINYAVSISKVRATLKMNVFQLMLKSK